MAWWDLIVAQIQGMQFWEAPFIKLKLIQIIVLDVQVLKTDEVEKLTEQNIVV